MKITCSKENLQKAGILSEKITRKNPTLPILNAVLITTKDNTLKFSSTNLEIGLEIEIPAKIEEKGSVAVPAKLFSNFISSLPDNENIQISEINNNLALTTKNTSTTINCYLVNDFPILPKIKEEQNFVVPITDFISGLKSVYYSTSLSEMKPEMNSIFVFSFNENKIGFTATDSFRLAEKMISCKNEKLSSFLIPYKNAIEIIRIFDDIPGDLILKTDKNNIVLLSNNIKFTSRLTEGNFIDYKHIIPNDFTNTATLNKKELSNSLKSAIMFCGKLNEIKIKIYEKENLLEIQTNNPELGEHTVTLPCETSGEDLSIVFNYRYLLECLSSFYSEKLLLKFGGENKPLLITGLNDTSFRYLVMPIRDL